MEFKIGDLVKIKDNNQNFISRNILEYCFIMIGASGATKTLLAKRVPTSLI